MSDDNENMRLEERREGRLHYYEGHFAETKPDAPSDLFVTKQLVDAGVLNEEDLDTDSAALDGKYAMAHYIVEAGIARIALKSTKSGMSDDDDGLDPDVREAAKSRFSEWAKAQGLDPRFESYEEIYDQ